MMRLNPLAVLTAVLITGFLAGNACAQEKERVFTLEESISEAFASNWTLKSEAENIAEAIEIKKQARTQFFPALSTTYSYTRLSEVPLIRGLPGFGDVDLGTRDNFQWRGTVTQPLFSGFAIISNYQLAKLGIDLAELDFELAKLDLALRVKEVYFQILRADRAVEVAQAEVKSLQSHLEVARNFYEVGMIPVNDLLEAEVELADAQYDLVQAEIAAGIARSSFNVVLSRPIHLPVEIEDVQTYGPVAGEFEQYYKTALLNRPEIRVVDVSLLQNQQQKRLALSDAYPDVSLVYDYIKEGDEPGVQGSPFHDAGSWQAVAVLSWTFFEWGRTSYAVRQNESVRRQLLLTREALEDQIQLDIQQAVLNLLEAEKNIPTTKKAIEQAEENLRVSQERYKAQVTTSTEVLDAQTLLTVARTNYYTALYNHHLAKAQLLRAMGKY